MISPPHTIQNQDSLDLYSNPSLISPMLLAGLRPQLVCPALPENCPEVETSYLGLGLPAILQKYGMGMA